MWVNIFWATQEVTRNLNSNISDSRVFMTLLGDLNSAWHPPAWIPPQSRGSLDRGLTLLLAKCTFSLWPLCLGTNLTLELDRLPTVLPSWLVFLPFWPKAKLLSCLLVSTHDSFVGYNWKLPSVWAWSSPKKCSDFPGSSVKLPAREAHQMYCIH